MLKVEGKRIGFVLVFCLAFSFFSFNVFADTSTVDNITINVPSSCTLTSSGTGTGETYTVNMNPRQYKNDIGPTTLSVFCNNDEGFSIYAIGFSDDEYGNNKMITTDPDTYIATGTATGANSNDPSNWAMKLTAVTGSGTGVYTPTVVSPYTNFAIVPATYAKVATVASSSTGNTEAAVQANYAVYVSGLQAADTYTGKVKYTVVHPASTVPADGPKVCPANTICYWPAANGVVDSMSNRGITSSTTSVDLWASNFKRFGYGFVGWSDKYDWELNANDASGNGTGANAGYHIYGPNQTITFAAGTYSATNGGLSLYAVWAQSAGNLQGWNGCSSLGSGKVTALTDIRDQDTYAVAKLADGKCWMIENLRLDYDANITTANTQSNNGSFGGVFAGLAQPETANFTATVGANDAATANSLYYTGTGNQGNLGATIDILQQNYAGYRMPRYRNDNTNLNSTINPNTTVANMTGTGQNVYSYGNYYTWAAAIADTSYYNTNNQSVTTTSLCPTGWRLPQGGLAYASGNTSGVNVTGNPSTFRDFYNLGYILMGSSTTAFEDTPNSGYSYYSGNTTNANGDTATKAFRTYPNNFLYSGFANTSSVGSRGSYGIYWSSTAFSSYGSYGLYLSSSVQPGTDNTSRYYGYSIRCLVGS